MAESMAPGARRVVPVVILAAILALAGAPDRTARPLPARAQAGPTATLAPWVPTGVWRALHAASKDPLWTTGIEPRDRPCGAEARTAAARKGAVPPLCAVHGRAVEGGGWIGWAVGEEGLLARYADGQWSKVDDLAPRKTSPKTYHLHDVFVVAADDVWAMGWMAGDRGCQGCGVVLHYDGQAWRELDRYELGINSCVPPINALDMQQRPDGTWFGWAIGDQQRCLNGGAVILKFDGTAWKWFRAPQLAENMHDVRIVNESEAWAAGELGSESFYNARSGQTGDWPLQGRSGAHNLFALDMVDPTYGWDGGVTGRLNRYDGNCHDDEPDTPCWFDNQANPIEDKSGNKVTNSIYAIDLLTRSQGWLVGEQDGRIALVAHFYADRSWRKVAVEGDPGKSLFGLHMIDGARGFAVGDEGTILEYVDTVPTATATPSPSATATDAPSPSPTSTDVPSPRPSPTDLSSPTAAATPVPSLTPLPTPAASAAPTGTATSTAVPPTPTVGTPGRTPTATATRRPTAKPMRKAYVPATYKRVTVRR